MVAIESLNVFKSAAAATDWNVFSFFLSFLFFVRKEREREREREPS